MNIDKSDLAPSLLDSSQFKFESFVQNTSDYTKAQTTIPELTMPVIGVFSGIFAKLNSMSVNKRFYSADFWRKVLASDKVKSDLQRGSMIGIFEHPTITTNYNNLGQTTSRHPANGGFVVKKLWIDSENVVGEAYLLNTPLGRLLATYFLACDRNGIPLFDLCISARGYSVNDYFDEYGIDQMNPNDYVLDSFDIVMSPGIKGAKVKMESANDPFTKNVLTSIDTKLKETCRLMDLTKCATKSLVNELQLKTIKL